MAQGRRKSDKTPCEWISGPEAFKRFATHSGGTESARHIKPLHWYVACRLALEGGFHPDEITPRPPFRVNVRGKRKLISFDPAAGGTGEQIILGGLKTKNVDVVVAKPGIGPVMAVSCKGVTKAFRNLTNRMEETIGECTNLHITYPALVLGYLALIRANRTLDDAIEAPDLAPEEDAAVATDTPIENDVVDEAPRDTKRIAQNDIAILPNGEPAEGIKRFHDALREMTLRHGIRDEISRYEAMMIAMVEPNGLEAGRVLSIYPPKDSPLHIDNFFSTLYQRYEERFVYGAPLLRDRGLTPRLEWAPESQILDQGAADAEKWPKLDYAPRVVTN